MKVKGLQCLNKKTENCLIATNLHNASSGCLIMANYFWY